MGDIKYIRRLELLRLMEAMQETCDMVRLVDPGKCSVVVMMKERAYSVPAEPCYAVWNRERVCENCISRTAYVVEQRVTKIEWRGQESYSVAAIPYIVEDRYGSQKMILELVNKVTDALAGMMDVADDDMYQNQGVC